MPSASLSHLSGAAMKMIARNAMSISSLFVLFFSLCSQLSGVEGFTQGHATRQGIATGPRRRLGGNVPLIETTATSTVTSSTSVSAMAAPDATLLAQGLGYVVAAGSFMLYTPIAVRLLRQKTADGLTMSTWWLKLASYSCSDIYAFTNGYPLSTYVETLVITVEALVILGLVAYYQERADSGFFAKMGTFFVLVAAGLTIAPPEIVAAGQASAALLNTGALIPQFQLNAKLQTAGDYSPVTALLAATGCLIRVFTTIQLAGSDPLLLGSFALALVLNGSLFLQILYYGVIVEKRDFWQVMTADLKSGEIDVDGNTEMIQAAKSKKEEDLFLLEPERRQSAKSNREDDLILVERR